MNSSITTASSAAAARCRTSSGAQNWLPIRRVPYLITGETGTGKELVARAIHDRSAQRDMPLIKVNCAAIPETLLESELFGHVRGAFTGATTTKKGKFALADGGTIFLDEIGTMNPTLQSKLLRVLQEREIEPLGSERTDKIDVRVIAATNRDLRQMVADGKFQEDLFYRLNVIPIEIPPLRERREDIPALVDHFVKKHAQRTGRRVDRMDDGVLAGLQQYDWPGNVRELENTIERAVVLSSGPSITAHAISVLGAATPQATGLPSLKLRQNIEWVERETIRRALEHAGGVKKDAAELMGISQRALSVLSGEISIGVLSAHTTSGLVRPLQRSRPPSLVEDPARRPIQAVHRLDRTPVPRRQPPRRLRSRTTPCVPRTSRCRVARR